MIRLTNPKCDVHFIFYPSCLRFACLALRQLLLARSRCTFLEALIDYFGAKWFYTLEIMGNGMVKRSFAVAIAGAVLFRLTPHLGVPAIFHKYMDLLYVQFVHAYTSTTYLHRSHLFTKMHTLE